MRRPANPNARRLRAHRAGLGAERIAVLHLRLKGYRVLARNFLVRGGEIDIVVARGDTVAFVEVKLRPTIDEARTAIAARKRERIARAARVFVTRHRLVGLTLRADAIYCAPWRWPIHVPAVFELDID